MSTGFSTLPSAGRNSRRRSAVASVRCGSSSPAASHASAQRIPRPPAFVSRPTLRPRGSGCEERTAATSTSSSSEVARMTPACRKSASTAASEPASAAVCELAARWPEVVVPLFSASTGFLRATRWARWPKRRGCRRTPRTGAPRPCRGRPPTTRAGRSWRRRPCCRSTRTTRGQGRAPRRLRGTRAPAPLWDEKPMLPRGPSARRRSRSGWGPATAMPRQLGPISRAPWARTSASSCSWRATPRCRSRRIRPR